ncbi:hypothetical protein COCCADRAFT_91166 [Bipolaris zeicola 26-R-13]|uniref:Uncharacterized protein n=1 Tax=Cochliobolus carbonum (strain 26-R-13) TaxID=930089 RepID=W6YI45_COCC2|nr:uncharacterized protein COCCADRAFT_91166 [Bipolaris zeicola 26-R-13]EUC35324.1 hypothetical protein COCCADRAFT_91166 [Bipolaris zeicola 26-R-13]
MILLLASLNDKPLPSWSFGDSSNCVVSPGSTTTSGKLMCRQVGISVNAVVSWLGMLTRLCFLVLLSNGLGQMKWAWLARPRSARALLHIETFDAASRGVRWGSMRLLWKMKSQAP